MTDEQRRRLAQCYRLLLAVAEKANQAEDLRRDHGLVAGASPVRVCRFIIPRLPATGQEERTINH